MKKMEITANGFSIEVKYCGLIGDYISLTDIAKYKTSENPGYVIQNWMRTRSTVRFLGLWENFHNKDFNYLEFEAFEFASWISPEFKLNVALFGMTAKMWREANPTLQGNIRDYATLHQLIVLVNLESMNAELIKLGLSQVERAVRLNQMAIEQLLTLKKHSSFKALKM